MHRVFFGFVVVALALLTPLAFEAQSPVTAPDNPSFEVASVKSNPLRAGIRGHSFPSDRFEARNAPLKDLVAVAYGEPGQLLPESQLSGGPSWSDSDRFDISAKVGGDSPNNVAQKQLMLRRLLTERFKLVVHIDTRNQPIYAMVRSRRDQGLGPQLHRSSVDCEALLAQQPGRRERCILYALPSGTLMFRGQTMSAVANVFTMLLNRVVKDQTGLTGGFDADAQFDPDGLPGMAVLPATVERPPTSAPSLFTALEEQLGLKLESTRGPVELLVIDSVERPTED